jgi:hypothetical protein
VFAVVQEREFSPEGMIQMRAVCRLMAIANPLMKRGLDLRAVYVHGQGYEIRARATGRAPAEGQDEEQDVNAVIDAFIRDPANQRSVFGQQAATEQERALGTDGEVFVALFTRPRSGWVQARTVAADEITEVICNPDDKSEPWFYRRVWQRHTYGSNGVATPERQEMLYPDVDYRPKVRPSTFAGIRVDWHAPVVHTAVNRPLGWLRGIPDAYAAINWARAYTQFLEQWATLMKSLARFAWKLTAEGRNRTQARAAIAATAITPLGATLEAIPKTGATIDAESGRPLGMMVAAALGVPVTMLLADPGQTGARATAETLDWPTELIMKDRREIVGSARLRICRYVITESVRAPKGRLKGTITRDEHTDREVVTLTGDTDDTIEIIWPDLDDVEAKEIIDGVVAANATGVLPPELVLRHLLTALGVRDVESIVEEMEDDDGNFQWPQTAQSVGQQAAGLAATGGDPAAAGTGLMGPDGEPADPPTAGAPGVPGQTGTALIPTDGPLARMADADFGLFGGGNTPNPAAATVAAGEQPDNGFDADFYAVSTGDTQETNVPDDEPARRAAPTTEAAGRQADADYGLGPSHREHRGRVPIKPEPAGEQPAGEYDPEFFTI